jgi:hypothetical protein
VEVFEVLGQRTPADQPVLAGSIKAPDVGMALMLARETHFRHKEGVRYAVRRLGETELHWGPYEGDVLGGVTDRSYRRQEAYAGIGARLRRVAKEVADRGLFIDRPRPPSARSRAAGPSGTSA